MADHMKENVVPIRAVSQLISGEIMMMLILFVVLFVQQYTICNAMLETSVIGGPKNLNGFAASSSRSGIAPLGSHPNPTFNGRQKLSSSVGFVHQHSVGPIQASAHQNIEPIVANSKPFHQKTSNTKSEIIKEADEKFATFKKGFNDGTLDVGDNVVLHYVYGGNNKSKDVLLFVHGFPQNCYAWRHQLQELKEDYLVNAVDLRGFGKSSKPKDATEYSVDVQAEDIHKMVLKLRKDHPDKNINLITHDIGAVIGSVFNYKYGDLIHRFVMINAPNPKSIPHMLKTDPMHFGKFLVSTPYLKTMASILKHSEKMAENNFAFLDTLFFNDATTKLFNIPAENTFDEADLEIYKRAFRNNENESIKGALNFFHAPGATAAEKIKKTFYNFFSIGKWLHKSENGKTIKEEPKFKQITAKTMILWGKYDEVFDLKFAEAAATECAKHILFEMQSSHWVQEDVPKETNEHLKNFINGIYDEDLKENKLA